MNPIKIKSFLEKLYDRYNDKKYLSTDPIQFCYKYEESKDIEIVGFISALFSYGNVNSIQKFLNILFILMEKSPFQFIRNADFEKLSNSITPYRFQTKKDILLFLNTLSLLIQNKNSLETYFQSDSNEINSKIINFQNNFLKTASLISKSKVEDLSFGFQFLAGSGKLTSANKRYSMYLRWMVRKIFPDFGIFKSIQPSDLVYPMDVHIVGLSAILGFSNKKTVNYSLAKEITNNFKMINPEDPLKYDFSLSRLGILKKCKKKFFPSICEKCKINKICQIYNNV